MIKIVKHVTVVTVIFALFSCATFKSSHVTKMQPVKGSITKGIPKNEKQALRKKFTDNDENSAVGFLEIGRFEQFVGNVDSSQADYDKATAYVAKTEQQALIRAKSIAQNVQALAFSDKERDYQIQDYEITFLYIYRALNFLVKNDLENAAVSIRNLSYAQYATVESKQIAKGVKNNKRESSYIFGQLAKTTEFRETNKIANKVHNSYENAFGYYLESLVYQAYDNDLNNAHLSMKNAQEMLPSNKYVDQDYQQMKKAFYGQGALYQQSQGKLAIIVEKGLVEPIKKFDLPIFLFVRLIGVQKISLPYYRYYTLDPQARIKVYASDNDLLESANAEMLVDTTAMAAKSLSDDYPAILARETARLVTKATIAATAIQASGDYGALTAVATSAYAQLTTVADQRSWNLLPNNVQLYSKNLDEGIYTVVIDGVEVKTRVKSGRNTLLWFTEAGRYAEVLYNKPL